MGSTLVLARKDFVEAITGTNVMVASHHGRENGFCDELFEYITPDIVLISDGPEGPTSVTDWYRDVCTEEGVEVYHTETGETEQRWVLTTRNDKSLRVRIGYANDQPVWGVEID